MGYLNTRGEWAIEPQFDEARDFSDGLAAVNQGGKCHMGGEWGYINRTGQLVIPSRYSAAGQFNDGYACVRTGKRWYQIDAKGNETSNQNGKCTD